MKTYRLFFQAVPKYSLVTDRIFSQSPKSVAADGLQDGDTDEELFSLTGSVRRDNSLDESYTTLSRCDQRGHGRCFKTTLQVPLIYVLGLLVTILCYMRHQNRASTSRSRGKTAGLAHGRRNPSSRRTHGTITPPDGQEEITLEEVFILPRSGPCYLAIAIMLSQRSVG